MDNMSNNTNLISRKILIIHAWTILGVCVLMGSISLISGQYISGAVTIAAGILTGIVFILLRNRVGIISLGTFLTQVQLLTIVIIAISKGGLYHMFPLMLASMAMGGVYLNKRNLIIHWIIMDISCIVGIFFSDIFYSGIEIGFLIKGIVCTNIGAYLITYLLSISIKYIATATNAEAESARLLDQVQVQMKESSELVEAQRQVVEQIANISSTVNSSSGRMKEVASVINSSAEDQQIAINEITNEIANITTETENTLLASEQATEAALHSKELLNVSNEEMQNMLSAMAEIETTSTKIQGIVKTIEDIAFQTNILALNASVEAARAGSMGQGFSVVAEEVRSLANKSAQAVNGTSELIESSMEAVQRGRAMANRVAEQMDQVMMTANKSAEQAKLINDLTKNQALSINNVKNHMDDISNVITLNSQTAVESTQIAAAVAEDAEKMDTIVRNYR